MEISMLDMTDDTALDTSIPEPSMTAGEVEMLLFALDRSRAQFVWKCGGLDAAAPNKAHPPSTMTLGGILKHMAFVNDWTAVRFWNAKAAAFGHIYPAYGFIYPHAGAA